jgi:hypothetical protein
LLWFMGVVMIDVIVLSSGVNFVEYA